MMVLESDRLALRRLSLDDAPFILNLLNQPSYLQFIGDKGVRTLDDARNYILAGPMDSYDRRAFGLYLTTLKDDGTPIGICGLLKRESLDAPDTGYAFLPAHWSRGYAFESASAVLTYARSALGLTRLIAVVSPDNARSIRLLEKLGLRFERMVRLSADEIEIKLFATDG